MSGLTAPPRLTRRGWSVDGRARSPEHHRPELTVKSSQILRAFSPARAAITAWARRTRARADAGHWPTALDLVHVGSVGLAFVLAAAILTLASLKATEAYPEIVGASEFELVDPASSSLVIRARAPLSPTVDSLSRCFDGALASMGGTVDGRGYQRTDPACQRR